MTVAALSTLVVEVDMHRSRLAGFIIDCRAPDLEEAARFWSAALGMPIVDRHSQNYATLDAGPRDLHLEVQRVEHESRIHVDIAADDVEAEVARLEALGARRVEQKRVWWIMEAPTGQRFCVVPAKDLSSSPGATVWPERNAGIPS